MNTSRQKGGEWFWSIGVFVLFGCASIAGLTVVFMRRVEALPQPGQIRSQTEDAARNAISMPGTILDCRGLRVYSESGHLCIRLLSGRVLYYRDAYLQQDTTPYGKRVLKIMYKGWNSDISKGPIGWVDISTYGGKLVENIVQATARDILTYALVNLDAAGYSVVLHVHDEIVAEILAGWGSIEEFERIMSTMPPWAAGWPVKASGGWRGARFKK